MKQLAVGLTILSTLVLATGCTDEPSVADQKQTGNAAFALSSNGYTLGITIDIFDAADDPEDPLVDPVDTVTAATEDASLVAALDAGSYIPVEGAWSLSGPEIDGTATDQDIKNVVFEGFEDNPFTVTPGNTTNVSILFTVNENPVVISLENQANFIADVDVEPACEDACGVGQICASVNEGPASCVTECDPSDDPEDLEELCGEGLGCLAATVDGVAGGGVCEVDVP